MMPEMDWDSQQHPSAPSTPNSFSSQSTGNSNPARMEKVPTLKQISPSPSVTALSKLSDEDLRRKGKEDLLMMLRRMETDYKHLLGEHGNVVKDVNRRYQIFILESRNLKEVNQKLQDDNQELRDLCCFLDDDRQRGRKLAREWQRFGRYTASVMRSEVAVYQEKLKELEQRQSELVTENVELKELCLFLDQERTRITGDRDEGDGSSNGTTTGQEEGIVGNETNGTSIIGSSSYLRDLELKVQKLEEEKRLLAQRINRNSAEGHDGFQPSTNDSTLIQDNGQSSAMGDEWLHGSGMLHSLSTDDQKPDAVVHAMKVLQVHEDLEKIPMHDGNWDDKEKAILREMCNVVWRKLGDVGGGDVGSFNESSDSILDPPPLTSTSVAAPGGLVPGVHGQAQSFSLQQPLPQMASTPLSSATNTKMSSSSHFMDPPPLSSSSSSAANQKIPESSHPSHLSSLTKPPQPSRQPEYVNQNQLVKKPGWPPQSDQRVDMYLRDGKDQVVTANVRPVSPMKKQEMDRFIHEDYDRLPNRPSHQNHSAHTKPYQYSTQEDEKIPPHFLPHRRQGPPPQYSNLQPHPTQQQPPPQQQQRPHQAPVSQPSQKTAQSQHPHSQVKPTPGQYHNPTRSGSSSSTSMPSSYHHPNTAATYNNTITDPSNQNQHLLTSSQHYPPHHSIRLLDAPGVHQQSQQPPNSKPIPDHRPVSKDDNYSSQKLQKPTSSSSHHPQMMYQRRDDIRSEPNISQSGIGRHSGSRGGPADNQPIRGPSRTGMDRQPESYSTNQHPHQHQPHHHIRFTSESSQGHQSMSSIPSSRPSNTPYHPESISSSHHGGGGGFSAYPPTSAAKSQHHHQQYSQGSRAPNQQQSTSQKTPVMGRAGQPRWNGTSGTGGGGVGGGKQPPIKNQPARNPYDDYDSDSL